MKTEVKSNPTWPNRVEILLLGATITLSSLVSLADFFGVLDGVSWLRDRIPTLTLLAVGLVASYILLERRIQLESTHNTLVEGIQELLQVHADSTRLVVDSLNGVEVQSFEDAYALLKYVNKRLQQAKVKIDDLSWNAVINVDDRFQQTRAESLKHWQLTGQVVKKIPYREVFIFNRRSRIEKLKSRIDENAPGYLCAYYQDTNVPVLQFMIIDQEEVVVLSGEYPCLAIRHPYLVKLFSEYYEDIWRKAIKLRDVKGTYQDEVKKVLDTYEAQSQQQAGLTLGES